MAGLNVATAAGLTLAEADNEKSSFSPWKPIMFSLVDSDLVDLCFRADVLERKEESFLLSWKSVKRTVGGVCRNFPFTLDKVKNRACKKESTNVIAPDLALKLVWDLC